MKRSGKFAYSFLSIVTIIVLIASSSVTVSRAESLSGVDQATLSREPQITPDGYGAGNLDLLYADPAAQIDLVQMPAANNQGDAQVGFPISVPPGRAGVQPDLALTYSSAGGSGWAGFGWDLSVGDVVVDTRWGVPRYSQTGESESYLLDGELLSPTAVRSAFEARQAEKKFQRRVEGVFERIVRHGDRPGAYWWEVTDKDGSRRYYGGTPEGGRNASAILTDAGGNEFRWGLTQMRDISNNTMTFQYEKPRGKGVGMNPNIEMGEELYLSTILYTGSVAENTEDNPAYEVRFERESRPDVQVDARGGFLRVSAERLKAIQINYRHTPATAVRRYQLTYTTGPFDKSLLTRIDQCVDAAGCQAPDQILGTHTFTYYNDVGAQGNQYNGFNNNAVQYWVTQPDNISSGIDLGTFGDGRASALGGTETAGADGRIYLGFNLYQGQKEGSIGVGLVFKGDDSSTRLEMIDINGDNLPDKVFEKNGQVVYRLNQSGPDGTTIFSDGNPLNVQGINHLSRESSFLFSIGPELYFGVSLMFNHAWAWSWGKAYFTDVNADGLPDFVNQGLVYFNHLDANNRPVFTLNSFDTTVPIGSGVVDPALMPDLSEVEAQQRAQAPMQDVIRRWRAPWDGQVKIEGDVQLLQPASDAPMGDGVRVAIQKEYEELWSLVIPPGDYALKTPEGVDSIPVQRGQDIYFRLQSRDDGASDQVAWSPTITYLDIASTLDANGLDVARYQAASDFTLGGRTGTFINVPFNGEMMLAGDFQKTRKTTDDITIQFFQKDGAANEVLVQETLIGRDEIGSIPFSAATTVIGPDLENNIDGTRLRLVLQIDSPVDLSAFSWYPQLNYTSATQKNGEAIPVVDENNQPLVKLFPPVDIQMYPGDDLAAPQQTWTAGESTTMNLTPEVQFCSGGMPVNCNPTVEDGTVTVTVKKKITPVNPGDPPSELAAKKVLNIVDGSITEADPSFTVDVEKDAEYWFDFSVGQPGLAAHWYSASVGQGIPSARHWSFIPEDMFPMPYRGWGIAGYNGDGEWGEMPIEETRLLFSRDDYPEEGDEPVKNDPSQEQVSYPDDFDGNYKSPAKAKAFAYAPVIVFDEAGSPTGYWRGAKDNLHGSALGQSSSRLGPDTIGMPGANFAGASGVTIDSMTESNAIAGGLGGVVGGSYAWGQIRGLTDFMDMNGDQFPDILGNGRAQYTLPRGGLEAGSTFLTDMSDVRKDSSTSKSFNSGGDAAEIKGEGKKNSTAPQPGSDDKSQTSGSIGLSGNLAWSSNNMDQDASPGDDLLESDLADMNGDGLPDRVLVYTGGRLKVKFNLGYRFDTQAVDWPGGSFEQGAGDAQGLGPSLGFSYGKMSFSGGISLSGATDQSTATWNDLNGDGLLDLISGTGGGIQVRFGTGAGLTAPVSWGAWQQGAISRSQTQGLSGGADFTIGIGPLCYGLCYLIINPGIHGGGGMSRREIDLRDVNGDGKPDHVFSLSDGEMSVLPNLTGRTNLLKSMSNPLGGSFEIDYTRQGNTLVQPYSQWVMTKVDVSDGRPGDGPTRQLTTYVYEDNVYDYLERDFLGYRLVTEEQRDTAGLETDPNAATPVLRSIQREYRNGRIFDKGLLVRETLRHPDGTPFKEAVYSYEMWDLGLDAPADLSPGRPGFELLGLTIFPRQVKTEFRRYHEGAIVKRTWTSFDYDGLGNVLQAADVGEPDLPADDVITRITYTNCTADGSTWVSHPDTITLEDAGGTILRSRRAEVLCSNGAITKLWEDTGSGEALTELEFDAYGNYNLIIYPPNENGERYSVNYVYDSDRFTDIARVEDSYGLVTTAEYDNPTGQVKKETDANGQVTSYTYDTYGRLASITAPYEQGTGNASVTFEYFPTATGYAYAVANNFDVFHPADPIQTVSFMDGIGRETETKQDSTLFRAPDQAAEDGMIVSGAVEFDALGRAVKEWYPIEEAPGSIGVYNYNTPPTPPTQTTWDIDDRVVRVVEPNGAVTTTGYNFDDGAAFGAKMFLDTVTDPLGNITRYTSDVRGNRLAAAVNHNPGTGVRVLQTTYRYDPLQQLVGVIDTGGNQTTHEYDLLGRRAASTTPDGGRVTVSYDLASNVTGKVTPNLRAAGGSIRYHYSFERLTGITYSDGTPAVAYTYGDPGAPGNGAGRVVQVVDGARVQQRAYGRQGELVAETTTMLVHNLTDSTEARVTWTTRSDFDTWGRMKSITYPDGEVITYAYDSGGLIITATGAKAGFTYPYLLRQEYDEFQAVRFIQTGNQVATESRYHPQNRRLERQIIDAPGRRIQDLNYVYDLVGNVETAENNSPTPVSELMGGTSKQTFHYDDLYRLTSATGEYNYSPNKKRTYDYAVTYDDTGNILTKKQTDTVVIRPQRGNIQQKTSYNLNYSYGGAAHQPTQIGAKSYTYDLNGNFTGWTDSESGQNRTVTWDAEDRTTSVADQGSVTDYKYADDGTLAIQRGPMGEISFVNPYYTVLNGTIAWKDIWAGADRIATKKQMPEPEYEAMQYFMHEDLLGSTNLITGETGKIYEHVEYFPGGETWILEHSDIFRVPGLYSGEYYDEFRELYNFGARWYEPREQFFYSPEPALVLDPMSVVDDPALLSAYTYAKSNPLRYIDPDGLSPREAFRRFKASVNAQAQAGFNRARTGVQNGIQQTRAGLQQAKTSIQQAGTTAMQNARARLQAAKASLVSANDRFKQSRKDFGTRYDPDTNARSKKLKAFMTFKVHSVFQLKFKKDATSGGKYTLRTFKFFWKPIKKFK